MTIGLSLIISVTNNDPLSILIKICFGLPNSLVGAFCFGILKCSIFIPLGFVGTTIVRNFVPLITSLAYLLLIQENQILSLDLQTSKLNLFILYNEQSICFYYINYLSQFYTGIFLSFMTVALITFSNLCLIGWNFIPVYYYLIVLFVSYFFFCFLKVTFHFTCAFYKTSDKILKLSRQNLATIRASSLKVREFRKMLISLRHHKVLVGYIGSIGPRFELNYYNSLQCRVMECLLFLKQFL